MIQNGTSWDYPIAIHMAVACELRINPRTWIVPAFVRSLWASHFPDYEDLIGVEAFSDEAGNIVFFFEEDWSEQYRLWILHHEMFHQAQFYDKGNCRGRRWDGMSTAQQNRAWETEACKYANLRVGEPEKDFQPYCTDGAVVGAPQDLAPRFKIGRKTRSARVPRL
jgi:hypothetical protein